MILPVHAHIRQSLQEALTRAFGLGAADQPAIVLEVPPKRALGDLATPIAFELARTLRKAPRAIAQDLVTALGTVPGVARLAAAPNGYVNFYLDRAAFLRERLGPASERSERGGGAERGEWGPASDAVGGPAGAKPPGKVIVEHTAINPNKAAHIGHLRNATLGDTLVRLLRFQRVAVEVQNYIDDTGVQVADVVVGFTELERMDLAAVQRLAADPALRFDYYCWDLYARVTEWYAADASRLASRSHALHEIEAGGNPLAEMGAFIADRIVRAHLRTMARLNVGYDLLTWEGDILRLHFWATAFDQLKARKAVFLQTEGRLKGCWVMQIESPREATESAPAAGNQNSVAAASEGGPPGAGEDDDQSETDAESREKVIVRSNGTVTYVGKDIANQFWKFGLLGKDFYYRVFDRHDAQTLWATTSHPGDAQGRPKFGHAGAVYNVIDSRQSYLQQLLKQALAAIGFQDQAEHSTHVAYEMVALSHATAKALGYEEADSSGKPFVEVSGRKGLGVKADDLLDRLVETAGREVGTRNPELAPEVCRQIAQQIAVAAVRYFLIKFSRGKVIAFDIDEAVSFEGETGPYLQYAVVRANNIFAKLRERDGIDDASLVGSLAGVERAAIDEGQDADELWGLVLEAGRLDEIVEGSIRALEPSLLAKYAFGLAQAFNAFYHRQQILREERADARAWRAAAALYFRRQLTTALEIMGCDVPVKM
jgi:arginyl-tRNA synthetase